MTLMNVRIPIPDEAAPEEAPISLAKAPVPALLFEMMRSFVVLARTLNLSHAVKELSTTRQTLRRHISALEEIKGGALFEVRDRRYFLTPLGEAILPEAHDITALATSWARGQSAQVDGLQLLNHEGQDGTYFYQQQHPLTRAFTSDGTMLSDVMKGWVEASGQLDHPALRKVRPLCNIFRRAHGKLVFTEVGDDSSFVSWFGATMARSTVGRALGNLPGGGDIGRLVNVAYSEIESSQAIRLDHVHTIIPKSDSDVPVPITYERLMLGARFPDQSPAIISAVRRTYNIEIKGISDSMLRRMPENLLM